VGSYSGTAGDSLKERGNYSAFSTKDRDNDEADSFDCAASNIGAWWYKNCHYSNLNGKYLGEGKIDSRSTLWFGFRGWRSLKFTEMKLRPTS